MKLLHTADLHIGKIVNEFSMLKDQEYILQQILNIAFEEEVDGVIIAGDVYDRSVPPAEAVTLLDQFLSTLIHHGLKVFMISGNHDSAERVGFAGSILNREGLYIGGRYDGKIQVVPMQQEEVKVNVYLLPFVKPAVVNYYEVKMREELESVDVTEESEDGNEDSPIRTFEESVKASLSHVEVDEDAVNILVTHHFVTAGEQEPDQSDSENQLSLGGIDHVDASVFDAFDYVALGHIHRPQRIGRDTIRYAGSPLKYSMSEVNHKKSVTLIEIGENKALKVWQRELVPLRDMRKIRGELLELMKPENYQLADTNDYIQATLTDLVELVDPIGRLRSVYPNIMQIIMEKNQKETKEEIQNLGTRKKKSPLELFEEFYENVTASEFDEKRRSIMQEVIEAVMKEVE